MHALAEAEAARAELAVLTAVESAEPAASTDVVYRRADDVADYQYTVAAFEELSEELRKAI